MANGPAAAMLVVPDSSPHTKVVMVAEWGGGRPGAADSAQVPEGRSTYERRYLS
jgi:hypothetical protein